jgi:hypothetical protein
MAVHEIDVTVFRQTFPTFADPVIYPDGTIATWWDIAACSMYPDDTCVIRGDCLQTALMLMTAHIGQLMTNVAAGSTVAGGVNSATIDKVAVSFTVPPFKNGWQFWLSQTPYGLLLWGMLQAKAAGGFYIGGAPERAAFRRVGGVMF